MTTDVDLHRAPARTVAPGQPTATSPGQPTVWWWNHLSAPAREAAIRVATCGGFLPAELSAGLVRAGVAILMPDDVRKYVHDQVTAAAPDRIPPR